EPVVIVTVVPPLPVLAVVLPPVPVAAGLPVIAAPPVPVIDTVFGLSESSSSPDEHPATVTPRAAKIPIRLRLHLERMTPLQPACPVCPVPTRPHQWLKLA